VRINFTSDPGYVKLVIKVKEIHEYALSASKFIRVTIVNSVRQNVGYLIAEEFFQMDVGKQNFMKIENQLGSW
jgi:hypothetical protein